MVLFDNIDKLYYKDKNNKNFIQGYFKISNYSEICIGAICCVVIFFLNGIHYDGVIVAIIALTSALLVFIFKSIRFLLVLKQYIY